MCGFTWISADQIQAGGERNPSIFVHMPTWSFKHHNWTPDVLSRLYRCAGLGELLVNAGIRRRCRCCFILHELLDEGLPQIPDCACHGNLKAWTVGRDNGRRCVYVGSWFFLKLITLRSAIIILSMSMTLHAMYTSDLPELVLKFIQFVPLILSYWVRSTNIRLFVHFDVTNDKRERGRFWVTKSGKRCELNQNSLHSAISNTWFHLFNTRCVTTLCPERKTLWIVLTEICPGQPWKWIRRKNVMWYSTCKVADQTNFSIEKKIIPIIPTRTEDAVHSFNSHKDGRNKHICLTSYLATILSPYTANTCYVEY